MSSLQLRRPEGWALFFELKRFLAVLYLKCIRKRGHLLPNYNGFSNNPSEFAFVATQAEADLENPHTLWNGDNALDSVQVFGMDDVGNTVIAKLVRRNDRCADVWLYIRLASGDEYQLPFQPEVRAYNTSPNTFSAAGLTFEVLEPLRRWKISFNGLLRKKIRTECTNELEAEAEIVHGRFIFIWCPIHPPFDSRRYSAFCNLSIAIAHESWTPCFLFRILRLPYADWYDQWGQMQGTISIDNNETENLFLRGRKERKSGTCDLQNIHRYTNIEIYFKDGTTIHLKSVGQKTGITRTVTGYILHARGVFEKVLSTDLHLLAENGVLRKNFRLDIVSESTKYLTVVTIEDAGFVAYIGKNWDAKVLVRKITVSTDSNDGYGVIELGYGNGGGCPLPPTASIPYLNASNLCLKHTKMIAVEMSDQRCCEELIVGGKGMSLALMTSFKKKRFVVPKGLCITVTAFSVFVETNKRISDKINHLKAVAWGSAPGDIKQECESVVKAILHTQISNHLKTAILLTVRKVFGERYEHVKVAVRSSAIGEDGEETSAAGQNDTVLGVKGVDHLWKALARCWASQFSFISVEYKRNNGQQLDRGMGVVIQEMVPADKAGVLFTRHPVTGNAGQMVITANYGLGESVVSATVDPDMITLKRTWQNNLSIESTEIGTKTKQINLDSDRGTSTNETSEEMSQKCCLSAEEALGLGEIGVVLEKAFGGPRDIEWAITGDKVYILQSRAITSFDRESDYLIAHELDSALLTNNEVLTKGNVGEVYPGALSPLSISTIRALFEHIYERLNMVFDPARAYPSFTVNIMSSHSGHSFLNVTQMMAMGGISKVLSKQTIGIGYALVGENFVDDRIKDLILNRHGETKLRHVYHQMMPAVKEIFWSRFHKDFTKAKETFSAKDCIPIKSGDDSFVIYNKITENFYQLRVGQSLLFFAGMVSSLMQGINFSILTADIDADVISRYNALETSVLLESCYNVDSADVPLAIEEIVDAIAKDGYDYEEFSRMPVNLGRLWLENNTGRPGRLFKEFIVKHGHRCVKEFDLHSKPWGIDKSVIVKALQDSFGAGVPTKKVKERATVKQSMAKIDKKFGFIPRMILSFIVHASRKIVGRRESAKSVAILGINTWRQAYEKLAKRMVAEGRIPDAELIYFLTHNEIGMLLRTRSARLLKKAQRRLNLHADSDSLYYDVLQYTIPKPVVRKNVNFEEREPQFTLQATSTCSGIAEGVARVVMSVKDASQIQQGDILITYFTDIGWSPYFPRIKAVVTELGGVISHGAVVAREYGIPCLISAVGATTSFKSGDLVRVDGTNGTIMLLDSPAVAAAVPVVDVAGTTDAVAAADDFTDQDAELYS